MAGKEIKGTSKRANYRHGGSTGWETHDIAAAEAAHEMAKRGKKQKSFFWKGHRIIDTPRNRKRYKDK